MNLAMQHKCYGCMICAEICPVKAIKIKEDEEGFRYPEIDEKICIKCGACEKICIANKSKIENKENTTTAVVYAAQNKNNKIRKEETSGGVFSEIASLVISKGGTVYGAVLNEQLIVEHQRADKQEELKKFYGSKYVQSRVENIYKLIVEDLKQNRLVLFSGTPCQVFALKEYITKKSVNKDNLITCDFVCHGVPSTKIFNENIKFLENKYNKKIISYKFRTKDYGWKGHNEKAIFEDGTTTSEYGNKYMNIYKELYGSLNIIRPSCFECQFSKKERYSDITMGDFWGIEKHDKKFADNTGTSLVIINTEKGKEIFEQIKEAFIFKEEILDICENPQLRAPTRYPKNREKFWQEYFKKGYKYIAKKYTTYGLIKKARVKTYNMLKKIKNG